MRTEILYEDNSILVIRKPAGLAVQSAGIGQPDVVSELKSHLAKLPDTGRLGPGKGEPYLGIVHRLDQPVEGVLVFAKEKKSAAVLTKQLSAGTLNKQYYAVLCGYPDASRRGACGLSTERGQRGSGSHRQREEFSGRKDRKTAL